MDRIQDELRQLADQLAIGSTAGVRTSHARMLAVAERLNEIADEIDSVR